MNRRINSYKKACQESMAEHEHTMRHEIQMAIMGLEDLLKDDILSAKGLELAQNSITNAFKCYAKYMEVKGKLTMLNNVVNVYEKE